MMCRRFEEYLQDIDENKHPEHVSYREEFDRVRLEMEDL